MINPSVLMYISLRLAPMAPPSSPRLLLSVVDPLIDSTIEGINGAIVADNIHYTFDCELFKMPMLLVLLMIKVEECKTASPTLISNVVCQLTVGDEHTIPEPTLIAPPNIVICHQVITTVPDTTSTAPPLSALL